MRTELPEYLSTLWSVVSQFQISTYARRKCKRLAWTKNEICVAVSRETRSRERASSRNLWWHGPKFWYRYSCRFVDGKYARMRTMCGFTRVHICGCVHALFLVASFCASSSNSLCIFRFSTFFFFIFHFYALFLRSYIALSASRANWSKTIAKKRT